MWPSARATLFALAICPCVLVADTSFGGDVGILLYGPDGPSPQLEDRALAAYYLQVSDRRRAASIRHVSSVFDGQPEVQLRGGGAAPACSGAPLAPESFGDGLDRVFEHLSYVETDDALRELARLEALLPCLTGVLPRSELARISFLDGVAQAYASQGFGARESFRKAFVVYPDLEWDSSFPPDAERLFVEAMQDALRSPTARLTVGSLLGRSVDLWVDGVPFPVEGGSVDVAAGRHLMQWKSDQGGFVTRVVDVRGDDPVHLLGREDNIAAALDGSGGAPSAQLAAQTLQEFARESGVTELYIVEFGAVDLLHRFYAAGARWEVADQGLVSRRARARGLNTGGAVSIIAGSALAVTGVVVGAVGHARAVELYEDGSGISNIDVYTEKFRQYETSRSQATAGWTLAGIGGAAVLVGIPLTAGGSKLRGAARGPAAEMFVQPSPQGVALTGSF